MKFPASRRLGLHGDVSTLVVEWIEITDMKEDFVEPLVSTLVVEWIEISKSPVHLPLWKVSTLVVEWIEIPPLL